MEFTFDLSQTPVIGRRQRPASGGQHYSNYNSSVSSSAYAPSMSSSAYGSYSMASTATLTSAMAAASSTTNVSTGVSGGISTRDLKDLKDSILTRSLGGGNGNVRDIGEGATASTLSPRRSFSITAADASVSTSGWKRPWMSQVSFWTSISSPTFSLLCLWHYKSNIVL